MPTRTQQNVTVRAGETRPIQMTVRDEDGVDIDISGETVIYRIARHGRTTRPFYLLDLDLNDDRLTLEDNGEGVFSVVRYDPGLLDLVQVGKHTHELKVIQAGGDARVVLVGAFTILDSVTQD